MTQLLHETMTEIAEQAPAPPAGLLDRVEAGYQRRRRRHTAFTAAAAVLVLMVGGWTVLRPSAEFDMTAGFHLPSSVDDPPLFHQTWPAATVINDLPVTPDGGQPAVLGRHDEYPFVLGRSALYFWHVWGDKYTEVVQLDFNPVLRHSVLGDKWTVIVDQTGDSADVWRIPAWGGARNRIATLSVTSEVRGVYAAGDWAYLSVTGGPGVIRVALANGTSEPLAGFSDLVSDGSGWARNADGTVLRNLVTGEERRQPRPADAQAWECVPAFCLGQSLGDWFLQEPGGDRERLPYPGTPSLIGTAMNSGILRVADGIVLDPLTGKFADPAYYAVPIDEVQCDAEWGQLSTGVFYRYRLAPDGGSCDGPWSVVYL